MASVSLLSPAEASPTRTEFRALVALAVPLAGANLIQMMVYAVDVIFVARLGAEKLAASSLPIVYAVILLSGVALDQRLGLVWSRGAVRELHLWSSELAVPVTIWHLIRFLPTALRVAAHDARRPRSLGRRTRWNAT